MYLKLLLWTWFQEFPYINTLALIRWSRSYFSSDMVLTSLYIKHGNKGGA